MVLTPGRSIVLIRLFEERINRMQLGYVIVYVPNVRGVGGLL